MAQNVTIGRIVRFVDNDHVWPAIVTVVHDVAQPTPTVSLQVFRQTDVIIAGYVPYASLETATGEGKGRGHSWHWPERG